MARRMSSTTPVLCVNRGHATYARTISKGARPGQRYLCHFRYDAPNLAAADSRICDIYLNTICFAYDEVGSQHKVTDMPRPQQLLMHAGLHWFDLLLCC